MKCAVHLGHVAVTTSDLDRLRRFYEATLGLKLVAIDSAPKGAARRTGVFGTDDTIALIAFEVLDAEMASVADVGQRGPIDHFSFRVETQADFRAVTDRLVAAGATDGAQCATRRGPFHVVGFCDPDGRRLNLVCPDHTWSPDPAAEVVDRTLHRRLASGFRDQTTPAGFAR